MAKCRKHDRLHHLHGGDRRPEAHRRHRQGRRPAAGRLRGGRGRGVAPDAGAHRAVAISSASRGCAPLHHGTRPPGRRGERTTTSTPRRCAWRSRSGRDRSRRASGDKGAGYGSAARCRRWWRWSTRGRLHAWSILEAGPERVHDIRNAAPACPNASRPTPAETYGDHALARDIVSKGPPQGDRRLCPRPPTAILTTARSAESRRRLSNDRHALVRNASRGEPRRQAPLGGGVRPAGVGQVVRGQGDRQAAQGEDRRHASRVQPLAVERAGRMLIGEPLHQVRDVELEGEDPPGVLGQVRHLPQPRRSRSDGCATSSHPCRTASSSKGRSPTPSGGSHRFVFAGGTSASMASFFPADAAALTRKRATALSAALKTCAWWPAPADPLNVTRAQPDQRRRPSLPAPDARRPPPGHAEEASPRTSRSRPASATRSSMPSVTSTAPARSRPSWG